MSSQEIKYSKKKNISKLKTNTALAKDNNCNKQVKFVDDRAKKIRQFFLLFKKLPSRLQDHMWPYVEKLYQEILQKQKNQQKKDIIVNMAFYSFCKANQFAKIQNIFRAFSSLLDIKPSDPILPISKIEISLTQNSLLIFEKPSKNFSKINCLNPSLHYYNTILKEHYPARVNISKQKIKQSFFYSEPKLANILLERNQLKNFNKKTNILYLKIQGSLVDGKNCLVIANQKKLQFWSIKENITKQKLLENIQDQISPSKINKSTNKKSRKKKQQDHHAIEQNQSHFSSQDFSCQQQQKKQQDLSSHFILDHVYIGHSYKIISVSLSSDQLYILSSDSSGIVKLWCTRMKQLLCEYKCHFGIAWCVNFCQAGLYFVTGGSDGLVKLWRTSQFYAIRIYSYHKSDVTKVTFMNNPNLLISLSDDKTAIIWQVMTAEILHIFKFSSPPINIELSFSGKFTAISQQCGLVTLLQLQKGRRIKTFKPNYGQSRKKSQARKMIYSMSFSFSENELVCISSSRIFLYSLQTLEEQISSDIYSVYDPDYTNEDEFQAKTQEILAMGPNQRNLIFCKHYMNNFLLVIGRLDKGHK